MTDVATGAGFVGTVTVYVTGDGGTQAIGTVGSGLATHEGNGYYTYRPSQAETNFASVAFTFTGTGAISGSTTYDTLTAAQAASINASSGVGTITVRALLEMCLGRIGVKAQGVTLSADSIIRALGAFNAFVDSLAANRLMMYGETRTEWDMVSGTQDYPVGPGELVDRLRPTYVEQLGNVSPIRYIDTSSSNPELEIPLTFLSQQQWRAIGMKALTGVLPSCAFYDPTYPTSTIRIWQVPTSSTLKGVLYAPTQMTEFALSDVISLPPGYRRFLITNVGIELCAEFEREPPKTLPALAAAAKADVERLNMRLLDMAIDPMWSGMGGGIYNIYSDTPTR